MHRGKGMKFVGDSRIKSYDKPKLNRDYSEFPGRTESFWPDFLLKEWMTGAVFLIAYLCLTVAHPSPLERVADPSDTGYKPLPDWYFLFLYQILKYSFPFVPFITFVFIVFPGIVFGPLLLAVAILFYTTWESSYYHDWKQQAKQGQIVFSNLDKSDPVYTDIIKSNCTSCHGGELTGGQGPNLVESKLPEEGVKGFVEKGA